MSHSRAPDRSSLVTRTLETDLRAGLATVQRMSATRLSGGGRLVECTGCGCRAMVGGLAFRCAACGSTRLNPRPRAGQLVAPRSVLPFAVRQDQASRAIRRWAAARVLAPRGLPARLSQRAPDDVYVPYWLFEADTLTRYRGRRGEDHWERLPAEGRRWPWRTRRTRRTRWRPVHGTVRRRFDDLMVCASRSLPAALLERLPPWDLTALVPYEAKRVRSAWIVRYGIELDEGLCMAQARMESDVRAAIREDIGGDHQRIHDMQVGHTDARFAHVLLPIWIRVYRYRGRLYRVLVDAQTGAVVGEHPWSPAKLLALALVVVLTGVLVGLAAR